MGQMQILWRLIVRPLRRSNIATSPASVRRLVCTSQPVLCSMASGTPRSWSSALARRVSPRFAAANPPTCRVSRFDCGSRNMASSRGVKARLEAMMFSHPTDCGINGVCRRHHTRHMLQIFSLKLANIPMERGSIELYGYIAARDNVDRLLNYVINFSREDPIIVEQGSLIDMAGPKRGIKVVDTTLIEFDMKIKAGRYEKQDLQLIDGVSFVDDIDPSNCSPFTYRIHGDCGAIDITAARLNFAVEATMEVAISQVQGGFSMRMGCFTSGIHKEIRLFDGAITESRGLKRAVIAVAMGDQMDLKFKVAADSCIPAEHCCSFKAARHGRATQEIKTEFALIAVKVTWSTLV